MERVTETLSRAWDFCWVRRDLSRKARLIAKRGHFVYAMLAMALFGAVLALSRSKAPAINIPAAVLTSYLMITALTTVRPIAGPTKARWLAIGAMLVAFGVGLTMLAWGVEAVANGGRRNGMPAFPFFMFATFGLLGAFGDLRVMRSGALKGASRLARHLWRMSIALFLAALSFSVQAASMLARTEIRLPGAVIALPMVLVLGTMLYWLGACALGGPCGGL